MFFSPSMRQSSGVLIEFSQPYIIHKGMVDADVHILILGSELQGDEMLALGKMHTPAIGHPPIIPVAFATMRQDHRTTGLSFHTQGAYGSTVLGVDRSVAIGITEGDTIITLTVHGDGDLHSLGLVGLCEACTREALHISWFATCL